MMELTAENVETVIKDCLFSDEEAASIGAEHLTTEEVLAMEDPPFKVVQGVIHNVAFHPERLESHRQDVRDMLRQLPNEFLPSDEGGGGGWSFLNLCMRADEEQWTGLHMTQEWLCTMAIALDEGQWLLPKEMWNVFPGGMPYFGVTGGPVTTE